jgi:hypothetical protein
MVGNAIETLYPISARKRDGEITRIIDIASVAATDTWLNEDLWQHMEVELRKRNIEYTRPNRSSLQSQPPTLWWNSKLVQVDFQAKAPENQFFVSVTVSRETAAEQVTGANIGIFKN